MTESAKVIQVIETVSLQGKGMSAGDPIREVRHYWAGDGTLLATADPSALHLSPGRVAAMRDAVDILGGSDAARDVVEQRAIDLLRGALQ